jgi:hypothetical protein
MRRLQNAVASFEMIVACDRAMRTLLDAADLADRLREPLSPLARRSGGSTRMRGGCRELRQAFPPLAAAGVRPESAIDPGPGAG